MLPRLPICMVKKKWQIFGLQELVLQRFLGQDAPDEYYYVLELKDFLSVDMFSLIKDPKGTDKLSEALQRALKKHLVSSEGSFSANEIMVTGDLDEINHILISFKIVHRQSSRRSSKEIEVLSCYKTHILGTNNLVVPAEDVVI